MAETSNCSRGRWHLTSSRGMVRKILLMQFFVDISSHEFERYACLCECLVSYKHESDHRPLSKVVVMEFSKMVEK